MKQGSFAYLALSITLATSALADDRPPPLNDFIRKTLFAAVDRSEGQAFSDIEQQFLSMAGREDLVAKSLVSRPTCKPELIDGRPADAIETIVKRANGARLVIINEAHNDPQGRAFIVDLLTRQHREGFTHYAAETFYPQITASAPSWPRMEDGFYSMEPAFGEIVRSARALAFTLVPYEAMTTSKGGADMAKEVAAREEGQARNLNERLLKAAPTARALVHVGHGHVYEIPVMWEFGPVEPMAFRLKRMSGVDPFTVEQTYFRSPINAPVVCAVHPPDERAAFTDIAIALPAVTFSDGRPTWRRARGQKPTPIPIELRSPNFVSIVEARYADEPDEAVPADRVLVRPGETLPLLLLPGAYRVRAWTREHGWGGKVAITVK